MISLKKIMITTTLLVSLTPSVLFAEAENAGDTIAIKESFPESPKPQVEAIKQQLLSDIANTEVLEASAQELLKAYNESLCELRVEDFRRIVRLKEVGETAGLDLYKDQWNQEIYYLSKPYREHRGLEAQYEEEIKERREEEDQVNQDWQSDVGWSWVMQEPNCPN